MMHWKVKRDPYYSPLYKAIGKSGIIDAGFFFDKTVKDFDIKASLEIQCTPLDQVRGLLGQSNPAIILSTGSFSPVHDGHMEMMENARRVVQAAGYNVIAGFIAPDHDDYISQKLGKAALPIHKRIKLINQACVGAYNWINVDPWAGVFHVTSVNFTDITHRLCLYIKKYLGVDIPIFYVCGSDNARFAKAFVKKGCAVIISRPGYEDSVQEALNECETIRTKLSLSRRDNILCGIGSNNNSSTEMRKSFIYPLDKRSLSLRVDPDTPVELIELFKEYFDEISFTDIALQQLEFKSEYKDNLRPIISMDPFITTEHNLQISRLYDCFGVKKLRHTNRPGSASLTEQSRHIPSGDYDLFDDDVVTGKTMNFAEQILKSNGVNIRSKLAFTRSYDNMEVLDARDFIYMSNQGGLVVKDAKGEQKRVPYIYPFVCPYIRASINNPLDFSLKVWKLNYEYHSLKGNKQLANECLAYFTLVSNATTNG